jgi:hypothetical protein
MRNGRASVKGGPAGKFVQDTPGDQEFSHR